MKWIHLLKKTNDKDSKKKLWLRSFYDEGWKKMKQIDRMPKSIVKALRYIKQDGPKDKLDTIQQLLQQAIEIRKQEGTR